MVWRPSARNHSWVWEKAKALWGLWEKVRYLDSPIIGLVYIWKGIGQKLYSPSNQGVLGDNNNTVDGEHTWSLAVAPAYGESGAL